MSGTPIDDPSLLEGPSRPPSGLLDERYRIGELLGRGGVAAVHRARDEVLGRDVAVKVFPPTEQGADDLERHRAEVHVLATLNHPGLVTLFDAGAAPGEGAEHVPYLVMELVEGPNLARRLAHGALGAGAAAALGRDLADALTEVHAHDVIHRDIKPANILLTDEGALDGDARPGSLPVAKLADFGIARLVDATRLTATGTTLGTVSYLSPEQATGSALGPATDVYALGLVLIECITGRAAFRGTVAEVAAARLFTDPPVPDGIDPGLADLLRAMTRRAPQDRPAASEVAAVLTALLDTSALAPVAPDALALASTDTRTAPVAPSPTAVLGTVAVGSAPAVLGTADVGTPRAAGGPARSPRRRGHRRAGRAAVVAVGATALVLGAGVAVAVTGDRTATVSDAPSYPAVDGSVGEALEALQDAVRP